MSILTNREKQIFELLINNHTTKEIASILNISRSYISRIEKQSILKIKSKLKNETLY